MVAGIFGLVFTWVTVPAPPAWASVPGASMTIVFQALGSMSVWFNLPLVGTVLVAAVGIRIFGVWVKLARMAASLFTGGGGNAGG